MAYKQKNKKLCKSLRSMIRDEKQAPIDYRKLAKLFKKKKNKRLIHSIIKDEQKHYRKLTKKKKEMC